MKYSNVELCAMVDEFRAFAAEPLSCAKWKTFPEPFPNPCRARLGLLLLETP